MPSITALSSDLVHLMAAGEVIDSWAAVVRELIDNALDAGATRITLELWPEDWHLRITDNGLGIPAADLPLVAQPYSTSKCSTVTDPFPVTSLGFRGEALHSLAQVSQLQIQTRSDQDPHGWKAIYDSNGSLIVADPAALARGTIVTVTDLFKNWPTRRTAIGTGSPVIRDVVDHIHNAALAHPFVTWQLSVNHKVQTTLWPGDSALDLLPQMVPRVTQSDLRRQVIPGFEVVVGLPDRCHRHRPDWIRVAVNRRFVRDPDLRQVLQRSFQQQLPRSRHPLCIALLTVPPEDVDWNRHPAKLDLYLQKPAYYHQTLQDLIQQTLAATSGSSTQRSVKLLKASEAKQEYRTKSALAEPRGWDPEQRLGPDPLIALAQLQNTYILAQHSAGLWLVEQHVAHERIRYEHYCQQWEIIELSTPLILPQLTPAQVQHLQEMELDPEPFGSDVWMVRRIPAALDQEEGDERVAAVLELSSCTDLNAAKITAACRTAIRNGTPLTQREMQRLLNAWQATANPHTCPHGRPIYLALAEKDLARYFRRNWTICDRPLGAKAGGSLGHDRLGDLFAAEIRGEG